MVARTSPERRPNVAGRSVVFDRPGHFLTERPMSHPPHPAQAGRGLRELSGHILRRTGQNWVRNGSRWDGIPDPFPNEAIATGSRQLPRRLLAEASGALVPGRAAHTTQTDTNDRHKRRVSPRTASRSGREGTTPPQRAGCPAPGPNCPAPGPNCPALRHTDDTLTAWCRTGL